MATETPKAAHAPGPWRTDKRNGRRVIGPNGEPVAVAQAQDDPPKAWANAALIAAAPDLYGAAHGVETLYAEMQAALPGLIGTPAYDRVQDAVRKARAALSKADGRG